MAVYNGRYHRGFRINHFDHQNFTVILYGSAVMAAQKITDTSISHPEGS